jgi:hypothetical protein
MEQQTGHPVVVVVIDIAGFSRSSDPVRHTLRDALDVAVHESLHEVEVGLYERAVHMDNGEGLLLLLPGAATAVYDAAVRFPATLQAWLLRDNRQRVAEARLRVRSAVHLGDVEHDDAGWRGEAIRQAFLLARADPVRQALRDAPYAALALALADPVYRDVQSQLQSDRSPERFRRFVVPAEAAEITGWVGIPEPGLPPVDHREAEPWRYREPDGRGVTSPPPPGPDFPTGR